MNEAFLEYFRCPESFVDFRLSPESRQGSLPCECGNGSEKLRKVEVRAGNCDTKANTLKDATKQFYIDGTSCILPFDPDEVAKTLRFERYLDKPQKSRKKELIRKLYYLLRPAFPVSVRRHLQKAWLRGWNKKPFPRWPVDRSVDQMFSNLMRFMLMASGHAKMPFIWFWPDAKSSCAIMTHDVETDAGLQFASELMDINDSFDIKSSFQLIPDARYIVDEGHLTSIKARGFEVNVHDLKHDGHLFDSQQKFHDSAQLINQFGIRFGSKGFRSAILYRNQEWFDELQFSYDMSVPNVGHLDPQPGGCCTVMPYFIGDLLELPVTATQDYTLFHVLQLYSQDLWRQQISQIMEQYGLISFIVHPDYLDTPAALNAYTTLLEYLSNLRKDAGLWITLPGEVDTWWRQRSKMELIPEGCGWRIEGLGAERATLAYAVLMDDKVSYEFA